MKLARLIAAGLLLFVVIGVSVPAVADEVLNIAVPTIRTILIRLVRCCCYRRNCFNVYEGLVKSTPDGQIPELWPASGIDSTQTVYTFYLREAYFHNGQKVTAADVVNALNRARDPEISQRASNYGYQRGLR